MGQKLDGVGAHKVKSFRGEKGGLVCEGYSLLVFVNYPETLLALKRGLDSVSSALITFIFDCGRSSASNFRRSEAGSSETAARQEAGSFVPFTIICGCPIG